MWLQVVLIVSEAGGMVSDFDEKNNWLLTGNIVATNPKIYDPLIKIIQQHIPEELRIKSSKVISINLLTKLNKECHGK